MSIKGDFSLYVDGNGLLAPNQVIPGTIRGSDNGPLFTSEFYILLNRNGQCASSDINDYDSTIQKCIGADGYLHRAPGDTSPDEIDDNLGVLAGYAEFNKIVNFNLPFALWRFPQLVYAWLLSKKIPSILMFPLTFITAIIVATSCIGADSTDSNSRLLNWLLWQATKRKSVLCNLAGLLWNWQQTKVYGTKDFMKIVAGIYFQPNGTNNNPYSKYWID